MYDIFVGTNSVRGSRGIYTIRLGADGAARQTHTHPAYNAGYIALHGGRLFAVSEGMTFQGLAAGGVCAYAIAPDGGLRLTGSQPSHGQRPCCVCADEQTVYAANFYGGTLAAFPLAADGAPGAARYVVAEPALPGLPQALHCVGLLPDGQTLGVVSLARMSLILYDAPTGRRTAEYTPEPGLHPRHFAPSPDGRWLYLLMQEPAELHVLERTDSALICRQKLRLTGQPLVFGASAVRVSPDGQFVAAAVRDNATLYLLRADGAGGCLAPAGETILPGAVPRDFAFTPDGRFLAAAMQGSDTVSIHRFEDGRLAECARIGIPSPASIAIREVTA